MLPDELIRLSAASAALDEVKEATAPMLGKVLGAPLRAAGAVLKGGGKAIGAVGNVVTKNPYASLGLVGAGATGAAAAKRNKSKGMTGGAFSPSALGGGGDPWA